jgi:hypothetical protein
MSIEEQITKKGLNRRDLIKKGAAASAVFWAIPVIESVTSAASATSGGGGVFSGASYAFIIYSNTAGTAYFIASYTGGGSPCNQNDNKCAFGPEAGLNNTTVTLNEWGHGTGNTIPSAVVTNNTTSSTFTLTQFTCTGLTQSGNNITSKSGFVIVAAFAGGGNPFCHDLTSTISGTTSGNGVGISGF